MQFNNKYINLLLFFFPFIFLFPYTFNFLAIGNDFELLYFSYKKYIFEFVKEGFFPLWSPSESSGYSLVFNPFAQYFYLPSWVLYLIAFIKGSLTKYDYTIYTILGLSIYNIGQYKWLKKININPCYALTATLITSCGLKLTEIIRFPNAVHCIAWFPWILLGITLAQNNKEKSKSFFIIFFSSLMILTAGYPYYILYGIILFGLYYLFVSVTNTQYSVLGLSETTKQNKLTSFFICFFSPLSALAIASPWLININKIMSITRDRNLNDINFSYMHSANLTEHLGSLLYPPISTAEGWYYMGIINSVLIVAFLASYILFKNLRVRNKTYLIFFSIILFFVTYQFAASENSIIFKLAWEQLSIIQNIRAWIRMNIILIPFIAILIAYSIEHFVYILNLKSTEEKQKYLLLISSILIVIGSVQIYFILSGTIENAYWDVWQGNRLDQAYITSPKNISWIFKLYQNWIYFIYLILSGIILILLLFKSSSLIKGNLVKKFLLICIIVTVSELFILSNIQWALPGFNIQNLLPTSVWYKYDGKKIIFNEEKEIEEMAILSLRKAFKNSNVITESKGNTYFLNQKMFNINYFDQFGYEHHTKMVDKYFNRYGKFKNNFNKNIKSEVLYFYGLDSNAKKIFFTNKINHINIEEFINDSKINEKKNNVQININYNKYNGDKVEFTVNSLKNGWISFIDNWDPDWTAKVNNKNVKIDKLFKTYKSIKINKGKSYIEFEYKP